MRFSSMCGTVALRLPLMSVVLLGGFSGQAKAGHLAVQIVVNAVNTNGAPLNQTAPGDFISFEVGIIVDPTYISPDQIGGSGNFGLTGVVYDVISDEANSKGYTLNPMQDAFSGFDVNGIAAVTSDPFFAPSDTAVPPANYGGGWGFNRAGLPGGGNTNEPGKIVAAGVLAPLTWTADTHPNLAGLQPFARLGVGIGAFTFPADDPVLGGVQGGFGFNINADNTITPGDGTWIVQKGVIDTTGWDLQTYNFLIFDPDPPSVSLFNGTLDYSQDQLVGFRVAVPADQIGSTSFSFTLVPEPSTAGALLLAGLGLIRRRRAT